ncbi:hypothetical protein LJY25_18490 [Hymenobacter sp. BT175]|uniref:hypothetical protein n=1 Tax=Hymenobacter translucens TaxID=2886507 RepID=UPI001D0DE8D9|nr:hypothetical protein [Hymenobacter translucens]MCC2548442.1 hypothetical protein [Hymenobacter translucens]
METGIAGLAGWLFVGLVAALGVLVIRGVSRALRRQYDAPTALRGKLLVRAGLLLWLGLTATLAATGQLSDFGARPPRLLLLLLPPLGLAFWLARSAAVGRLLNAVPRSGLIYLQSCRVVVEVVLWLLFLGGAVPVQMTFEGLNWDVLTGLTAPLAAYFCFRAGHQHWKAALAWNLLGLALLLNIVTIAMLSAPMPIRQFFNEPANTVITHFPMIWLPTFVVPLAYCLHVLSIRQLWRLRKTGAQQALKPVVAAA